VLTADFPPANWSGIGTAVFHQTNALRQLGVEVEVLTRERLAGARFPLEIRDDDIVHLHSLALAELALELKRRFGLPLVYTAHSVIERELGAGARAWAALQQRVFGVADAVIFVSRAEREAVPELERARVLHNGLPPLPPGSYDEDGPIVFAGRYTHNKGLDIVLDLAERIPREFILAGGHGDADLERRAASRSVGWLAPDALHALLASAAMVLMPSRYEPFGMVALEAMRAGAPLLASDALREVAPPESIVSGDWSEAVSRLLDDRERRRAMHARGALYVAEHFDALTLAGDLLALLHTVDSCRRCST
jgi:glycosyltransferase involved in cell wall biosynthesis